MAHQTVTLSPGNARCTVQSQKEEGDTETQRKAILKVSGVGRHPGLLNKTHDLYRLSFCPVINMCVCVHVPDVPDKKLMENF